MATPPASTKSSLTQRLRTHAGEKWPDHRIETRFRGQFAYIDAIEPDGDTIELCRLRYTGSATIWGFALYRASHDDYQTNFLPTGHNAGTPEDALDCPRSLPHPTPNTDEQAGMTTWIEPSRAGTTWNSTVEPEHLDPADASPARSEQRSLSVRAASR